MAFVFKSKPVFQPKTQAKGCLEVYIGIDFGTTFTKVSFQVGDHEGTTKYSLKFQSGCGEEDYCLPSRLGFDSARDTLVFCQFPEEDGLKGISYFKYSMIEKGIPRDSALGVRQNDPQRLCSAFYLAHVLKMSKDVILRHRAVAGRTSEIKWYVNMGVPVSDFNAKPKPIYDEALNAAWGISELPELSEEMQMAALDELYSRWVDHSTWSSRLNTVPELYAELIMFLQDKAVDTGFYSVVDIGGGTVDLAVFFKHIDIGTHKVEISCVAQEVCPLGYEMYRNGFVENPESKLRCSYGTLVSEAYSHHRCSMENAQRRNNKLIHFYMGGAREVPFYHERINEMIRTHERSWKCYPGAQEDDILRYMRGRSQLDVSNNRRLVISQMLAQPYEKMPELTGNPWNFDRQARHVNAPDLAELNDFLYAQ